MLIKKLKFMLPFIGGALVPIYSHGILISYEFLNSPNIGQSQALWTMITVGVSLLLFAFKTSEA